MTRSTLVASSAAAVARATHVTARAAGASGGSWAATTARRANDRARATATTGTPRSAWALRARKTRAGRTTSGTATGISAARRPSSAGSGAGVGRTRVIAPVTAATTPTAT